MEGQGVRLLVVECVTCLLAQMKTKRKNVSTLLFKYVVLENQWKLCAGAKVIYFM